MSLRLGVLLLLAAVGCDGNGRAGQIVGFGSSTFNAVTLTPTSASLNVGDTVRLVATPLDTDGQPISGLSPASFTTSDQTVAIVNDSGTVTAVTAGAATITAT